MNSSSSSNTSVDYKKNITVVLIAIYSAEQYYNTVIVTGSARIPCVSAFFKFQDITFSLST